MHVKDTGGKNHRVLLLGLIKESKITSRKAKERCARRESGWRCGSAQPLFLRKAHTGKVGSPGMRETRMRTMASFPKVKFCISFLHLLMAAHFNSTCGVLLTVRSCRSRIMSTALLRFDSRLAMFLGLITSKTFLPPSEGEIEYQPKLCRSTETVKGHFDDLPPCIIFPPFPCLLICPYTFCSW